MSKVKEFMSLKFKKHINQIHPNMKLKLYRKIYINLKAANN